MSTISLVSLQVISSNSVPATTSLEIAKFTGKEHKHVLRDIETLIESQKLDQSNFGLISYEDSYGRKQKAYVLDETFTTVLLMGFTGDKALDWKLVYTKEFQAMRENLTKPKEQLETTFNTYMCIAERLGLKNEQAAIHANYAMKKLHNTDVLALIEYKVETKVSKSLTDWLQGTGISARKANLLLCEYGYLEGTTGNWKLVDKGSKLRKVVPEEANGKMRSSIEWYEEVIEVVKALNR